MVFRFPLQAILPSGRKLLTDHMTTTDLTDMYQVIVEAAQKGEGFGENEYSSEGQFHLSLRHADRFIFKDAETMKSIAWLTLSPSGVCRTTKIRDPLFVVADAERGKKTIIFCVRFFLDYCAWKGDKGILADVFSVNHKATKTLLQFGFKKVGHLDIAGEVKGHGYIGLEFYFRDLSCINLESVLRVSLRMESTRLYLNPYRKCDMTV